ncbi:MAG TPA: DUF3857 and transglutaminase domain-containing protein [Pyrinomonadaceae bacterium]|nr:DUF3857 and transglutaminase domain-containing protein [Pyrinomonadaceae bacterium]
MKKFSSFAFLFFIGFLTVSAFAQGNWRQVTQAELDMKTPQVEADADAEAIFWEVSLDDKKRKKLFYNHYVRVKIFTERGREKFSKIDIPFTKGKIVEEVAARVIKPDGTFVQLSSGDIFEREIIRYGKIRVMAKSFAIPAIEPGVIVEYQYNETFKNDSAEGERLVFQRDIPMQRVTYSVRPFEGTFLEFDFRNMERIEFNTSNGGFYVGTLTNVPALKQEPQLPPEDEIIKFATLSYRGSSFKWNSFGNDVNRYFAEYTKSNKEIESKALELTRNLSNSEEKIQAIYDFTTKQIRNLTFDPSLTDEQREKIEIKNPADALRKRMGFEGDLNMLFASLLRAAGVYSALVMSSNRNESFFTPERNFYGSGIHPAGIAVGVGTSYKFVNPGNPYLPFGKLQWYEEGSYALIAGDSNFVWKKLPVTNYLESSARRTGKFKLLEDGTLEGTMTLEYDGHQAINRRMNQYKDSPAKREENIKEEIKSRISTAEISELSMVGFDDATRMLTYSMKIRVPNYAAKTGKRMFFQPGFFEYGTKPLFSSATRTYPVYFEYPWSEEDIVEIELPKNFLADNAASPGGVNEAKNVAGLNITMSIDKATNTLKYKRKFFFGNGVLFFPTSTYPALKTLWDNIQKSDSHTISIKQSE